MWYPQFLETRSLKELNEHALLPIMIKIPGLAARLLLYSTKKRE